MVEEGGRRWTKVREIGGREKDWAYSHWIEDAEVEPKQETQAALETESNLPPALSKEPRADPNSANNLKELGAYSCSEPPKRMQPANTLISTL